MYTNGSALLPRSRDYPARQAAKLSLRGVVRRGRKIQPQMDADEEMERTDIRRAQASIGNNRFESEYPQISQITQISVWGSNSAQGYRKRNRARKISLSERVH
jgi:hypothetical protein